MPDIPDVPECPCCGKDYHDDSCEFPVVYTCAECGIEGFACCLESNEDVCPDCEDDYNDDSDEDDDEDDDEDEEYE